MHRNLGKITSKLQLTLPKVLAERYGIRPGDEIEWQAAGAYIRIVPPGQQQSLSRREQLALFDQSTRRQEQRQGQVPAGRETETVSAPADRGWRREDLYSRGDDTRGDDLPGNTPAGGSTRGGAG